MINENKNPKVKILVGYHKPAVLLKDDILTPIHLGRILATQASKDGEVSKEDFEWMCENMIGDDTGDNISYLNRYFCELTGIYWAWKNYEKLENPDYIGFMHYRRHFIFDEENSFVALQEYDTLESFYLNNFDINYKAKLYSLLSYSNIIVPNPYIIVNNNIENNYKSDEVLKFWETDGVFFDILREIIKNDFPQYVNLANNYFLQNRLYCFNMFIMPRDIFIRYCEFVFGIIFKLFEQTKNIEFTSLLHMRNCAYIGEIVTGLFFEILNSEYKNTKKLNVALFRDTEIKALKYYSKNFEILNLNKLTLENSPKISVIMPCYNRESYISQAIESILRQTYVNFEFIIIDDCSTDNTLKIASLYAKKDGRIILVKKFKNSGIVESLNIGLYLAKGKYIARMDDDDISLPQRFEKQIEYMNKNPEIAVLGSLFYFIKNHKIIKNNTYNWVKETEFVYQSFILHFFCGMCHPTAFIRKEFLDKNNLFYLEDFKYSEDYGLWVQILKKGGKIANYPEVLLYYRLHPSRSSITKEALVTQKNIDSKIKTIALYPFLPKYKINEILEKENTFLVFNYGKRRFVYEVLTQMRNNNEYFSNDVYDRMIKKYCGIESHIHIFFACDDNYVQHLCVCIASILKNSLPNESFSFYILDGGLESRKKILLELKKIKDFEIEFIQIDKTIFENIPLTIDYITKETYYRYIIPLVKPELKKCLYLDCDIVVEDSLNFIWNINLKDKYVAAVKDTWITTHNYYKNTYNLKNSFNAGVLLINLEQWKKDKISEKLFLNTEILSKKKLMQWQDQDILNYTFGNKWIILEPRYNVQYSFYKETQQDLYDDIDLELAKRYPIIVHYTGIKPWKEYNCEQHPLWEKYWEYIKFTVYREKYLFKNITQNSLNAIQNHINFTSAGAVEKVKAQLSFKLGKEILSVKENKSRILILPFTLIFISIKHKISNLIYKLMLNSNPNLKSLPLNHYSDFQEALKIQNYLSYKLGNLLIKHPFTFIFRVAKVCREWKDRK
ncbi:TPA: glycosyltransferase [Campylobacter jejuni]